MRLLFIGNSHVGNLIRAYQEDDHGLDINFLAIAGNILLPNLNINEQLFLYSSNKKISDMIINRKIKSLKEYDYVFIYGCQLRAAGAGQGWLSLISSSQLIYSKAALKKANKDFIYKSSHYSFLKRHKDFLKKIKPTKIISIPSPMTNELIPGYHEKNPCESLAKEFDRLMKDELKKLNIDCLDTPKELRNVSETGTKSFYKNDKENDFSHINISGSRLLLKNIADYVLYEKPLYTK